MVNAQHWSITNIAGDGGTTFTMGDAPLENGFVSPRALAKDSENNIYFTSFMYSSGSYLGSIYKLSSDYSTLEEIISDVTPLTGIAIDKNNNLYFSKGEGGADIYDLEYIYVRHPDGSIEEFAGNGEDELGDYPESEETALGHPIGNAGSLKVITESDGQEYLYYSATLQDNNFIQKINIESGLTYRVAGIPSYFDEGTYEGIDNGDDALSVKLNLTLGLGADSKGNIYYLTGPSGEDAYSVKKIVDGNIYHVAGNGESEYFGDGGPAKDAGLATNTCGFTIVNDTMYLCDIGNHVIRKIPLSTTIEEDGNINLVAGTTFDEGEGSAVNDITGLETQPAFNTNMSPIDILHIDGDFIISDINSRIRKMFWCVNPVITDVSADLNVLCLGDSVTLTLSKGGGESENYIWGWLKDEWDVDGDAFSNGPSIKVPVKSEAVTYFAYGYGGCAYEQECFPFEVKADCKEYYNSFTPNGDGKNDFLEIPALNNFTTNTVVIYNRWGDVLEEHENYDSETVKWEGTNGNGDPVDSGTYYFTAVSGGEVIVSGWVQVIRE